MRQPHALPLLPALLLLFTPAYAETPPADGPKDPPDPPPAAELHPAPGYERCVYDVSDMLQPIPDSVGPSLNFDPAPAPISSATFTLGDPRTNIIGEENLVFLLRDTVAPDTWADGRGSIRLDGNRLIVVQPLGNQKKVARQIAYLRGLQGPQIVTEGTVALVEDAFLDELRAGARDPAALDVGAAKALNEALAKGTRASLVRTLRATAWNSQRVHASDITEHRFVPKYTPEETPAGFEAKPDEEILRLGTVLDIRPVFSNGRIRCEVRFTHRTGALPIPQFETGVPGLGSIGLPETGLFTVNTTFVAREGETALVGRIAAADRPVTPATPSRSLCLFVCHSLLPRQTASALVTDQKHPLRILDVRFYSTGFRDFPEMTFGINTGRDDDQNYDFEEANRFLPEVGLALIPSMSLLEMVKTNIAPGTWDANDNYVDFNYGCLLLRQAPEVVEGVGRYLDSLAARMMQRIATRAEVLAVDDAGYNALRKRYPSLGVGSTRLDAVDATALVTRAAKGDGLSLAASGEIVGMNKQLVHVQRAGQRLCVGDYTAWKGPTRAVPLPRLEVVTDGILVECRPVVDDDLKTVHANVRLRIARLDRPMPVEAVGGTGLKLHRPTLASTGWRASVVAEAGAWVLVGETGPTPAADGKRLLALMKFVPIP